MCKLGLNAFKLGLDVTTDTIREFETLLEQEQEVRRQSNVHVQARL
jgi:hypothetical protein